MFLTEEFAAYSGIGGWRGRTEKSGPPWYMRDGKLVSDPLRGPGHF